MHLMKHALIIERYESAYLYIFGEIWHFNELDDFKKKINVILFFSWMNPGEWTNLFPLDSHNILIIQYKQYYI